MLVFLAAGCEPRTDSPDAAYRAFTAAAQQGDVRAAWSLLSAPTQRAAEERFGRLVQAGAQPADDPALMLLGATDLWARPLRDLVELRRDDTTATLKVTSAAGAAREVRMVREAGGWRVDLSGDL